MANEHNVCDSIRLLWELFVDIETDPRRVYRRETAVNAVNALVYLVKVWSTTDDAELGYECLYNVAVRGIRVCRFLLIRHRDVEPHFDTALKDALNERRDGLKRFCNAHRFNLILDLYDRSVVEGWPRFDYLDELSRQELVVHPDPQRAAADAAAREAARERRANAERIAARRLAEREAERAAAARAVAARTASGTVYRTGDNCAVCLDAPVSMLVRDCGHLCACADCAERLPTCPVCRAQNVQWERADEQ